MAEVAESLESTVSEAKAKEREFDWQGAADLYERALSLLSESDIKSMAEVREPMAYALFKAAFQSDTHDEFERRTSKAIECYEKARDAYQRDGSRSSAALGLGCEAMAKYIGYWQASKAKDKQALAEEAWELSKKSLVSLSKLGGAAEYCRAYDRLTPSAKPVMWYEGDFAKKAAVIKDVLALGEQALARVTEVEDPRERALTYSKASSFLTWYASDFSDTDESIRTSEVARGLWEKAKEASEELTYFDTIEMAMYGLPRPTDEHEVDRILEATLQLCKRSKDRLVTGNALSWISVRSYYKLAEADDSEELEAIAAHSYDLSLRAQREYAVVGYLEPDISWTWPPCPDPWHYGHLSNYVTDPGRKKETAEKALKSRQDSMEYIMESGYPDIICDIDQITMIALTSLARTEKEPERKAQLLQEALETGTAQMKQWEKLHPLHYGSQSFSANMVADTEFELATLEKEPGPRERKLRQALKARTKAVKLTGRLFIDPDWRQKRFFTLAGLWESKRGICAQTLYELTKDRKDLEEAIAAFESAVDYYTKADIPSRCAENLWSAARAHDALEEYGRSKERFTQAAQQYKAASERLPQLNVLYQDHSKYMDAWSEVEQAKQHHLNQEYGLSGEHFGKAARLLESTHRWKFLSANYSAWSSVEKAEGLSNTENCKGAMDAFNDALGRFEESRKAIQERQGKARDSEEAQMAGSLAKVAELRKEYCRARTVIEEARLLEKQAQESASSREYAKAVEMLERILSELDGDRDREEIGLAVALAKAWQNVTSAEAESSPDLFGRAAGLFEQVKDLSRGEKAKSLALGHSRFCKALEAGMRFSDTGDASFHAEATTHLESAAKHYLRADCRTASEYANASKLLFDGYAYMDRASKEEDQGKKTKLYTLAEKVLEASAASFEQAEVPGKKDQVLKLLVKVGRDKQLAVSLTEALRAPDIVSTSAGFTAPTASHETATGLERFEHAYVQSNLMARPRDLHVGQDVSIVIEIVNAGKGTAQLTKVEDMVPRGFDLVTEPERYRVEDTYINMRGRRLDALKTEDLKLVLKPTVHGQFKLRPRIMYLDESGKYRSHEPEPVDITVKELGISGWLKGPERK